MPTFPRYGQSEPPTRLISRPQIQEAETRDSQPRLQGFLLREVGSVQQRSVRATPQQFYLPGAPFTGDERKRLVPQNVFVSDPT